MAREGEKGQVKLLVATLSPFVVRVRIALALKGIDYEIIQEDLKNKSELLLQSNPVYKQIPVLIHNGKPICESMIIMQYIEEVWDKKAPKLLPKDPYDRAIARFWTAFIDDKLLQCLRGVLFDQGEQQHKAAEESVARFLSIEDALRTNGCFSGKQYFGGDEIGLVDIALGSMLPFLKGLEKATDTVLIDVEKVPLLRAWMDRFCTANGVKEVMPNPAKQLEVISARRALLTSAPPRS